MSKDDDSKKPGPEDDGWGDVAGKPEPVRPPASVAKVDPVQLKDRVAALHAKSKLGSTSDAPSDEESSEPSTAASAKATSTSPSPQGQGDSSSASGVLSPSMRTDALPTSGDAPAIVAQAGVVRASQVGAVSTGSPYGQQSYVPTTSAPLAQESTSAHDDSPPWTSESQAAALPSSDMMAAAGVLGEKEKLPAAKKRRKREKRKERDPKTQLTRRQQVFLIGGAALLVVAAVSAVLGYLNSKNFYLVCGTRSITAEQGSFWPYGRGRLSGEAFQPIVGDHPCTEQHFEKREDVEKAFLAALIERSTRLLSSKNKKPVSAEDVTAAEQQLEQAFLLSRGPERSEERAMAERLQGDVLYWRGAAEIKSALKTLRTSADYFAESAASRPRHSIDSSAWAEHARFITSEIDKGPRSLRKDESAKEEPHFQGLSAPETKPKDVDPPVQTVAPEVAVPVAEPPIDAGVDASPPPRVDAGLPTGGVLL